ncbi:MAG: sensor domain-containing diguanylate cyclase [Spirochaetales bacterium]|nr:sensor domain-containing diguanylate cyclase [Spirochaetales bacterium]
MVEYGIPDEIQNYEKKIYDQRQLIEISRALNSTLDYEYLIQAVLDICLAQVQTLQAALFLTPDMDADEMRLMHGYKGFDLNQPESSYTILIDSPLVNFFETNNKSLTVAEFTEKINRPDPAFDMLRSIGVELLVPLRAKGKVNGIIALGEKAVGGEYNDSERGFLVDLASLGGIAVENARLYERATVDMMTGLKNNAYFQSRLKEERDKARKRGTPLAVMFTDVDKFKVFNDTYGHQAGDEVLKSVARVLIESARKSDFAARYGGEEFCLVMPGASADVAVGMAEAVRQRIEAMTVIHEGKEMKVTMSIGVATFDPELDARSNKTMVERADKALYACKRNGRNQVQLYRKEME